jgi:hypothetical protein
MVIVSRCVTLADPVMTTIGTTGFVIRSLLCFDPTLNADLVYIVSTSGLAVVDRFVALVELHVTNWTLALDGLSLGIFGNLFNMRGRSRWSIFEDLVQFR